MFRVCIFDCFLCVSFVMLRYEASPLVSNWFGFLLRQNDKLGWFCLSIRLFLCVYFVMLRDEAAPFIERLVWIPPSSEWQIWMIAFVYSIVSSAFHLSCWGTKHLLLVSNLFGFLRCRNDKFGCLGFLYSSVFYAFLLSCWGTKHLFSVSHLFGFLRCRNDNFGW